jgi:hypothetical protein
MDDEIDEEPEEDEDDETKGWTPHTWPELIVNQILRQRVSPRIGTRKEQMQKALSTAFVEIADGARKGEAELVALIEEDAEKAIEFILESSITNIAMAPVIAKLTSVYVLAAEQAKANLAMFAEDDAVVDDLEPLFELLKAKNSAESSILGAVERTLTMTALLTVEKTRRDAALFLVDAIGIHWEDASKFVDAGGEGDAVIALYEKFAEQMADHAIVHMCNLAQEALWRAAASNGIIDPNAVSRLWITRLGCRSCNECSGMDGVTCAVDGTWNLPKGDTVVSPTKAHSECHCTERLVRKEVDK